MIDTIYMIENRKRKSVKMAWPKEWELVFFLPNKEMAVFISTLRTANADSRGPDKKKLGDGGQLAQYRVSTWHRELDQFEFGSELDAHADKILEAIVDSRSDSIAQKVLVGDSSASSC